jgi:membrane protease YdiL (CAAX protease family)
MATPIAMPDPREAAAPAVAAARRASPGLLAILAGFALLYTIHVTTTNLTNSLYGEYGLLACALALATALVVERLAFGRGPLAALRALGLGRPGRRALAAAALIALLMVATWPLYAVATGKALALRSDWLWLAIGIVAQYGIAEEVIFRGYLFGHLRAGRTFRRALLISTLVFAAAHLPLLATNGLPVAVGAIALAVISSLPFVWLFELGGATIWAPVIVHAAAHTPKLLAPGTLDMTAELAWIGVVMVVPYLAFALLRRGRGATAESVPTNDAIAVGSR